MRLLLVLLAGAGAAWAQGSLGGLTGRVTDASGAPMPDVTIQLRNIENGQETKSATTAEGSYLVTNLAPGATALRCPRPASGPPCASRCW